MKLRFQIRKLLFQIAYFRRHCLRCLQFETFEQLFESLKWLERAPTIWKVGGYIFWESFYDELLEKTECLGMDDAVSFDEALHSHKIVRQF